MKRLYLPFLLLLCLTGLIRAADAPLTPRDLEGKTLEQLYLMRNEIYARHGRPFKTNELDSYFQAQSWYQRDLSYGDSRLTETDEANIKTIKAREDELLKLNYLQSNGEKRINTDNLINARLFPKLTADETALLGENGFVVLPAAHDQFFYLYESNLYQGIASFVTTDAMLQMYHIFFDMTLRDLESAQLYPAVLSLTKKLLAGARETYQAAKEAKVKEAARRNLAYFFVANCLLTGEEKGVDAAVAQAVHAELQRCLDHAERASSLIFDPKSDPKSPHFMEYTMFVPRGHYTRSTVLKRYFLGMSWYGLNYFLTGNETDLVQSLLIVRQLYAGKSGDQAIDLWLRIYEPTAFYVGTADKLGPEEVKSAMDQVYGAGTATDMLAASAKLAKARSLLKEIAAKKTKIQTQMAGVPAGPQFRLMGQRYVPDTEIMQKLTKWPERPFPKGLDVMAALGSAESRSILLGDYQEAKKWPAYQQKLDALEKQFAELKPADWRQNLYYHWFWTLQGLLEPAKSGSAPFFAANKAWERKRLQTALGSWTELRHDTILYGESSAAEGEGDDWVPDPAKGYAEPNAAVYDCLAGAVTLTKDGLKARSFLTGAMGEKFDRFRDLLVFLANVSRKETAGSPLTLEEYARISEIGSALEWLTISVAYGREDNIFTTNDADRRIALIADVHTSNGSVLEEAVGSVFEIYVAVEIEGYLKLTRGGVFSYYEFIHPASDRLTDEKWQEMLAGGKIPAQPGWTRSFTSPTPARKMPETYAPGY